MLSPRERAVRALCLEEPDRIPLFDLAVDLPIVKDVTGKALALTRKTIEKDLKSMAECNRKLGLDFFVYYPSYGLAEEGELSRIDERTFVDVWGGIRRKLDFPTLFSMYVDGSIKTQDDFEKFEAPSVNKTIESIKKVERTLKSISEEMFLVGAAVGGFEIGLEMRGIAKGLTDYYLNPGLTEKILEMVHKFNMEVTPALIDAGAEAVIYDDDYADTKSTMLSPTHWRKFVRPTHDEFVRTFKKRGVFVLEHSDGNLIPIIEDMMAPGLDALHPIEPQAMDIESVKERYGDKICVIGNVDCGNTMVRGSEEDVRRDVRRCIDQASPGGGQILSASNTLNWQIPTRNVLAMMHEGKRYGKYDTVF